MRRADSQFKTLYKLSYFDEHAHVHILQRYNLITSFHFNLLSYISVDIMCINSSIFRTTRRHFAHRNIYIYIVSLRYIILKCQWQWANSIFSKITPLMYYLAVIIFVLMYWWKSDKCQVIWTDSSILRTTKFREANRLNLLSLV